MVFFIIINAPYVFFQNLFDFEIAYQIINISHREILRLESKMETIRPTKVYEELPDDLKQYAIISSLKEDKKFNGDYFGDLKIESDLFSCFERKSLYGLNWFLEALYIEDHKFKKKKRLLERWVKKGLLPAGKMENGEIRLPGYALQRIEFIDRLIFKWQYDFKKLKLFTDYEEMFINEFFFDIESHDTEFSNLEFYIIFLKKRAEISKQLLNRINHQSEKDWITEKYENSIKLINFFEGEKYYSLPDQMKNQINYEVANIKNNFGAQLHTWINRFRAQSLLGFSYNVAFEADFSNDRRIIVNAKPQKYPYCYETYGFRDWIIQKDFIVTKDDFFATPEFLIEFGAENNINLIIRDPQKVDSRYMRRIGKIYTKFRNALNPPKKKWGEVSGRKKAIEARDRMMKEIYERLKNDNPNKSAEARIIKTLKKVLDVDGEISPETAKRIIYSKK